MAQQVDDAMKISLIELIHQASPAGGISGEFTLVDIFDENESTFGPPGSALRRSLGRSVDLWKRRNGPNSEYGRLTQLIAQRRVVPYQGIQRPMGPTGAMALNGGFLQPAMAMGNFHNNNMAAAANFVANFAHQSSLQERMERMTIDQRNREERLMIDQRNREERLLIDQRNREAEERNREERQQMFAMFMTLAQQGQAAAAPQGLNFHQPVQMPPTPNQASMLQGHTSVAAPQGLNFQQPVQMPLNHATTLQGQTSSVPSGQASNHNAELAHNRDHNAPVAQTAVTGLQTTPHGPTAAPPTETVEAPHSTTTDANDVNQSDHVNDTEQNQLDCPSEEPTVAPTETVVAPHGATADANDVNRSDHVDDTEPTHVNNPPAAGNDGNTLTDAEDEAIVAKWNAQIRMINVGDKVWVLSHLKTVESMTFKSVEIVTVDDDMQMCWSNEGKTAVYLPIPDSAWNSQLTDDQYAKLTEHRDAQEYTKPYCWPFPTTR